MSNFDNIAKSLHLAMQLLCRVVVDWSWFLVLVSGFLYFSTTCLIRLLADESLTNLRSSNYVTTE